MTASSQPRGSHRMLGGLLLLLYAWDGYHWFSLGTPGEMLWLCHVAALALALGSILGVESLIRPAVPWTIAGVVPWIGDAIGSGSMPAPSSIAIHLGSMTIGLLVLRQVRAGPWAWLQGIGWYLVIQQLCRHVADPELNVNLSIRHWGNWEVGYLPSYGSYWLFTTVLTGVILWGVNRLLLVVFPPFDPGREAP